MTPGEVVLFAQLLFLTTLSCSLVNQQAIWKSASSTQNSSLFFHVFFKCFCLRCLCLHVYVFACACRTLKGQDKVSTCILFACTFFRVTWRRVLDLVYGCECLCRCAPSNWKSSYIVFLLLATGWHYRAPSLKESFPSTSYQPQFIHTHTLTHPHAHTYAHSPL